MANKTQFLDPRENEATTRSKLNTKSPMRTATARENSQSIIAIQAVQATNNHASPPRMTFLTSKRELRDPNRQYSNLKLTGKRHIPEGLSLRRKSKYGRKRRILTFSITQLVGKCKSCILIGYATRRLLVVVIE